MVDDLQKKEISEIGVSFLLADFENARSFKEQSVSIAERRIDILLTLVTAFVGGLVLLSQSISEKDRESFLLLSFLAASAVFAVGLVTFIQILIRDVVIVDHIRALNRIRSYFAENVEGVKDYLLLPASDVYPKYSWVTTSRFMLMIVNGFLIGGSILMLTLYFQDVTIPSLKGLRLASLGCLTCIGLQWIFANRYFQYVDRLSQQYQSWGLYRSHVHQEELNSKSQK